MWKYTTIFIPFKYSVCKTCVKSILLHIEFNASTSVQFLYDYYTEIKKGMLKLKFHPLSNVSMNTISVVFHYEGNNSQLKLNWFDFGVGFFFY